MNKLLWNFLREISIHKIKYYSLDEYNNLLYEGKISIRNNEWILFQRKEKLKILNTLENE